MNTENLKLYGLFVTVLVTMFYVYYAMTRFENKKITIDNDKSGDRSQNLISDTDGTMYKVANAPLVFHFKSSEVLNTLKSGNTFVVSGYGSRVPVFGLYPVITSAKKF